jgi:hypothetical protein
MVIGILHILGALIALSEWSARWESQIWQRVRFHFGCHDFSDCYKENIGGKLNNQQ